jgi:hypothetical protein
MKKFAGLLIAFAVLAFHGLCFAATETDPCPDMRAYYHDAHQVQPYYRSQSCRVPYVKPFEHKNAMTGYRRTDSPDRGTRRWAHAKRMQDLIEGPTP